jgi:hypothetical protein
MICSLSSKQKIATSMACLYLLQRGPFYKSHHMDPITFQVRMKDLHHVPHANSILQHFTTTFIEFNMILIMVEMIVAATINMN